MTFAARATRNTEVVAAMFLLASAGCIASGTTDPGTANTGTDNRIAFPAYRINASWSAGKTGLPSTTVPTPPPNGSFGAICAPSTIVAENHPTQYPAFANGGAALLLVGSSCTSPVYIAICRTGVNAATQVSSFGKCADDPRLTEVANVAILRIGSATTTRPLSFGETSAALDVVLFFCSNETDFNFALSKPKPGVAPTDCVER